MYINVNVRTAHCSMILCFGLLVIAGMSGRPLHAQQDISAGAQAPLVLKNGQDEYLLGPHVSLLEDPHGSLTIDDVTSPAMSSQFMPSTAEIPNFGFTPSVYWVRIPLSNQSGSIAPWTLELEFSNLQYVDLYSPGPAPNTFDVRHSGAYAPLDTEELRHVHPAFQVEIPPSDEVVYYLRLESGSSMTMPLLLRSQDAFQSHVQTQLTAMSLFMGALLGFLAYNILLFATVRQRVYLYLAALLASLIVFEYLYAGYARIHTVFQPYLLYRYVLPLACVLTLALLIPFASAFLNLKERAPRLYRANRAGLIGYAVVVSLQPFTSYRIFAMLGLSYALLATSVLLVTTFIAWQRGLVRSRFFTAAWYGMLLAFCITIMVRIGLLPSTVITERAFEVGTIWMAVCWSVALADQIRALKADVEKSAQYLSSVLDGLPVAVVVYGTDRLPKYINRGAGEILANPARGITPDLSARRSLEEAMDFYSFRVQATGEPYPLTKFPVHRALQGETSRLDDIEADLVDRRVPLEIMASPVFDGEQNVTAAVVAFHDVTTRRETEAELQRYQRQLEELVQRRTTELSALNQWMLLINELYSSLSSVSNLAEAAEELLSEMARLTGAESLLFAIAEESVEQVVATCLHQDESGPVLGRVTVEIGPDSPLRSIINQNTLLIIPGESDRAAQLALDICRPEVEPFSLVLAPINTRHEAKGCLLAWTPRAADSFTREEINLYERIRGDLVKMSEYQHLYEEVRRRGATEERSRLARDLHDSVTQVLFSASVLADVLPQTHRRDPDQAGETIDVLRLLIRGALAEMRTLLLELRPASIVKTPLHSLLSQLAEAIASRSNLSLRLLIEQVPVLPEMVHVGIYRIAQEALNNVVKHAHASSLDVQLSVESHHNGAASMVGPTIRLVIRDDGIGIEPDEQRDDGMGLGIMTERAREIEADLTLTRQPGGGTTATLTWPGTRRQPGRVIQTASVVR